LQDNLKRILSFLRYTAFSAGRFFTGTGYVRKTPAAFAGRRGKNDHLMTKDEQYVREAITLAKKSVAEGGGPFGAIVVKDGKVIATASNRVTLDHDPTAHAEILAIRKAAAALGTHDLSGCTVYSSCEPCPMCLGAVYWARPDRLVFAAGREDALKAGFDDSFIYDQLTLETGERSIPTSRISTEEALDPFILWEKFSDKTPY